MTTVATPTPDARPRIAMGLSSDATLDGRVQREAASLAQDARRRRDDRSPALTRPDLGVGQPLPVPVERDAVP
jgi:hypothetical protein